MDKYLDATTVETTLKTKKLIMEWQKANKPSEINILDYTVIAALEKQMPKKVTHEATLYKCCTCPNCKNVIDRFEKFGENNVRVEYMHCHFCGQKLDWD